jgi:hypothetical protein
MEAGMPCSYPDAKDVLQTVKEFIAKLFHSGTCGELKSLGSFYQVFRYREYSENQCKSSSDKRKLLNTGTET